MRYPDTKFNDFYEKKVYMVKCPAKDLRSNNSKIMTMRVSHLEDGYVIKDGEALAEGYYFSLSAEDRLFGIGEFEEKCRALVYLIKGTKTLKNNQLAHNEAYTDLEDITDRLIVTIGYGDRLEMDWEKAYSISDEKLIDEYTYDSFVLYPDLIKKEMITDKDEEKYWKAGKNYLERKEDKLLTALQAKFGISIDQISLYDAETNTYGHMEAIIASAAHTRNYPLDSECMGVWGMPGMGTDRVVKYFVKKSPCSYKDVLWITAKTYGENPYTIRDSFKNAAYAYCNYWFSSKNRELYLEVYQEVFGDKLPH